MNDHDGEALTPEQVAEFLQVSPRTVESGGETAAGRRDVAWVVTFVAGVARCWSGSRSWTLMARQKRRAGELGAVQAMVLPSGGFQACARVCDEVGEVHQLKASGTSAALAETALREKADAILNDSGGPTLIKDATITETAAVFLYDKGVGHG